jgi:hypothetical protein
LHIERGILDLQFGLKIDVAAGVSIAQAAEVGPDRQMTPAARLNILPAGEPGRQQQSQGYDRPQFQILFSLPEWFTTGLIGQRFLDAAVRAPLSSGALLASAMLCFTESVVLAVIMSSADGYRGASHEQLSYPLFKPPSPVTGGSPIQTSLHPSPRF